MFVSCLTTEVIIPAESGIVNRFFQNFCSKNPRRGINPAGNGNCFTIERELYAFALGERELYAFALGCCASKICGATLYSSTAAITVSRVSGSM